MSYMKNSSTVLAMSLALVTAFFSTGSIGAESESEWVLITQNSDDTRFYSGKKGSFELGTTKGGTPIAMVVGQVEDKKDKSVAYQKWYVATSDCDAGMGKLVVLKVSGEYDMETEFVAKGKNIASGISDLICNIYRSDLNEKQNKGV